MSYSYLALMKITRSCKSSGSGGKGTSTEVEYKAILDNFLSDLISALRQPDFPGAEILLSVAVRSMVSSLSASPEVKLNRTE